MECKLVSSRLAQYLDEDLPEPIYREISDHLDHCYLCWEEYHELVRVTDLAREALRCGTYRDRYDVLRAQLRQEAAPVAVTYFSPRLRVLRAVFTGLTVAAAALVALTSIGLPAIETLQTLNAAMQEQAFGEGEVPAPEPARGHSLMAWSSQIRWAESLTVNHSETKVAPPEPEDAAMPDPVSSVVPVAIPFPFCRPGVIV